MTKATTRAKLALKQALFPVAFQFPPIVLAPERLRIWLNALLATERVPGEVIEVGCAFAGTASYAAKFLNRRGDHRHYTAFDTFTGFVDDQFSVDAHRGTSSRQREVFSANSLRLAQRVVARHGSPALRLVQGDICDDDLVLPDPISACLIDVDLEEPVYAALVKSWQRLSEGGIILVDDCDGSESEWRADEGYRRFVREHDLPDIRHEGLGMVGDQALLERVTGIPLIPR